MVAGSQRLPASLTIMDVACRTARAIMAGLAPMLAALGDLVLALVLLRCSISLSIDHEMCCVEVLVSCILRRRCARACSMQHAAFHSTQRVTLPAACCMPIIMPTISLCGLRQTWGCVDGGESD